MALPVVKTLADCVDIHKTVLPYIPQLYALPQQILQTITNPQGLKALYISTNPLVSAVALSLFLFPVFLIVSEVNRNYSQVDRCWSILPTVYNAHFTIYATLAGLPTQRLDILLALSTFWSCRLTFNYWRRGGYSVGSEDYRWAVLKENMGPALMFLFNVAFISLAQSILLVLITLPTYAMLLSSKVTGDSLSHLDKGIVQVLAGLIMMAGIADQQQWDYHHAKDKYKKDGTVMDGYHRADLERGFNTTGVWAYSRHPNFAAEQSFWVCIYLWGCLVTKTYYNWTGIGALCYLFLFQASTWFTELITAKKYADYAEYQKRVGKFIPLGSSLPGDFRDKRVIDENDSSTKKTR